MRLKLFAAYLAFTTVLTPLPAHAGIVESIVLAISTVANAVGVSVAGQAILGSFLFTALPAVGSALLYIAGQFALNALFSPQSSTPAPQPQEIQSNYQLDEAPRFDLMGRVRAGGALPFTEVKDGTLRKLVAHGDAEATSEIATYLNDIPVTLDGSGFVTNDEFVSRDTKFYRVTKRYGTPTQAAMSALTSVFSEWTSNHRGAGVCDTLLILQPVPIEDRGKILRHRGALGLGEPDLTRAAWYGRYYDPRNDSTAGGSGTERVDDQSTWGPNLGNPVLCWAKHRLDPERFNNDAADINWSNVAEQAAICDETVTDKYGSPAVRYEVALAINKDRHELKQAEDWILAACDGVIWTDDDGKLGVFVGKYDSDPDLVLTDTDIGDIESMDGADGEGLATHYFASYTEPAYAFKATQSAEWIAPDFDVSKKVVTRKVELYQVPNHNQNVRLLKAAVGRQHETKRLSLVADLRGLKAKRRRFLRLDLSDADLSGVYEIVSAQDAYDGLSIGLVLIKCGEDRWNLLAGEEGDRPTLDIDVTIDNTLTNIVDSDMHVQAAEISGVTKLIATFVEPSRSDLIVQIQNRIKATSIWNEFSVRTEDGAGTTDSISDTSTYEYRWRVYTVGGNASDWSSIFEVSGAANTSATANLTGTGVNDSVAGEATYQWTAPGSSNYYATRIYRAAGASSVFGDATEIRIEPGLPGDADSYTEAGLSAGDYRAWMEPLNGSLVAGTLVGPIDFTIT